MYSCARIWQYSRSMPSLHLWSLLHMRSAGELLQNWHASPNTVLGASVPPLLTCPPIAIMRACLLETFHVGQNDVFQYRNKSERLSLSWTITLGQGTISDRYSPASFSFHHHWELFLISPIIIISWFRSVIPALLLLMSPSFFCFSYFLMTCVTSIQCLSSSWFSHFHTRSFLLSWCSWDSGVAIRHLLYARKSFKYT